jgi:DNA-binding response OmpR family regulator
MAGYRVLIAPRAREVLALFRRHDVDLVLTEHVAPATIDGPALSTAMKILKSDVPVAILSADVHASSEDRRFADVFITKLVSVDELPSDDPHKARK